MSDKKITLIAQLLAKAEATTPEEAEALTEHAERLMIKYGIDQAVINERRATTGNVSEKIVTVLVKFTGSYRLEHTHIGHMAANGLGNIKCLMSTFKNASSTLYLIGFESDVAQAQILIASLQVQSAVATRVWWRLNKGMFSMASTYDQEAARRSFVRGFGTGAGVRIRNNRKTLVEEAGTGTELVLVSREAKVQSYFDNIATSRNKRRGGKSDSFAAGQGYAAGQNANTGEKVVNQRGRINA